MITLHSIPNEKLYIKASLGLDVDTLNTTLLNLAQQMDAAGITTQTLNAAIRRIGRDRMQPAFRIVNQDGINRLERND